MRRMNRWITAFVLVLALFATLSSGALAKTKVTVVSWYTSEPGEFLDKLKQAFEAANSNYEIEYIMHASNVYYNQIQMMMISEVVPDIAMLGFDWIATMANNGMAMNIDKLVREQFPYKEMFPSIQRSLQWKGQFYALCRDITAKAFYYNKAHFNEAGIKAPADNWTWEDFISVAQKLQRGQGDTAQRWAFVTSFVRDGYYHWFPTNSSDWFNADRSQVTMTNPRTVETFQFLQDLVYKVGVAPTPALYSKMKAPFETQISSMQVGGSTIPDKNKYPNLEWAAGMLPQRTQAGSRVWSNLWFIPSHCKNVNAAWKVLSFFAGPEGQRIAGNDGRMPAIRSVALEMNLNPYVVRAFDIGVPFPVIANREVWSIFDANLPKIWSNAQPPALVVEEIQRQVEPIM